MFRSTISIRNNYSELERLLREVTELMRASGMNPDSVRTVNLGMEEVITNILKYGYDDDREHQVEVVLAAKPGELLIEVRDDGREFNPLAHPKPDTAKPIDQRQPGGLGIEFLRNLFDRVSYQREEGRNCLLLHKRLD